MCFFFIKLIPAESFYLFPSRQFDRTVFSLFFPFFLLVSNIRMRFKHKYYIYIIRPSKCNNCWCPIACVKCANPFPSVHYIKHATGARLFPNRSAATSRLIPSDTRVSTGGTCRNFHDHSPVGRIRRRNKHRISNATLRTRIIT